MLFALSGNECAHPDCKNPVVEESKDKSEKAIIAQIAHIVPFSEKGPRGETSIDEDKINSYENLILLCPTHHVRADKIQKDYPTETLRIWKKEHESKELRIRATIDKDSEQLLLLQSKANEEITAKTQWLIKTRFFIGIDQKLEARKLSERVISGDFQSGSAEVKNTALCWCSRILAATDHKYARGILKNVLAPKTSELYLIADALITFNTEGSEKALNKLKKINSPTARSLEFFVVTNDKNDLSIRTSLHSIGFDLRNVDSDGKLYYLRYLIDQRDIENYLRCIDEFTDTDFNNTPSLLYYSGLAHLLKTIEKELWPRLFHCLPLFTNKFQISTDQSSIPHLEKAKNLFLRAAGECKKYGANIHKDLCLDYALWIELINSSTQSVALEKLREHLRKDTPSLVHLRLALDFGIDIDHEFASNVISKEHTRTAGSSAEVSDARFTLIHHQGNIEDCLSLLREYKEELSHIKPEVISSIEIELLAIQGNIEEARDKLEELINSGITSEEKEKLELIISQHSGNDETEKVVAIYKKKKNLTSLNELVAFLHTGEKWELLTKYASELYEKNRSLKTLELLVQSNVKIGLFAEALTHIENNKSYLEQSEKLLYHWALSNYFMGRINVAQDAMCELSKKSENYSTRNLLANIHICTGDWEALSQYIEEIWLKRDTINSEELLRAANFALLIDSGRYKDLINQAVNNDRDNPTILLAAHDLSLRKEGDSETQTSEWLNRAIELSGDEGPIKKISIDEISSKIPEWSKREKTLSRQLDKTELPIFYYAKSINKPLSEIYILNCERSKQQKDPRWRPYIYSVSAKQRPVLPEPKSIGLDFTTLLTMANLDILDETLDYFEELYIPHNTLFFLLEENYHISFHQPSLITKAKKLCELVEGKSLEVLFSEKNINSDLQAKVGYELSEFLEETFPENAEEKSVYIVASEPHFTPGSLLKEKVDLSEFQDRIVSCSALLNKIREKGQITKTKFDSSKNYILDRQELLENEPEIKDGAKLLLDSQAARVFLDLGIIDKIRQSGYEPFISASVYGENKNLKKHQSSIDYTRNVLDELREFLKNNIGTDKIKFAFAPSTSPDEDPLEDFDLIANIRNLATVSDAIVVDDRFFNRFIVFDEPDAKSQVISTVDILNALKNNDKITLDRWIELRTLLRQSGHLYIPIESSELQQLILQQEITGKETLETAELKAIRQSLEKISLINQYNYQDIYPYLESTISVFAEQIRLLWETEKDSIKIRNISNWGIDILLNLKSAIQFCDEEDKYAENITNLYTKIFFSFWGPLEIADNDLQTAYWEWFEQKILEFIKKNNLHIYHHILDLVDERISGVVDSVLEGGKES